MFNKLISWIKGLFNKKSTVVEVLKPTQPEIKKMSYSFSESSLNILSQVHPDLQRLAKAAIAVSTQDFKVIEGLRTPERQKKLKAQGNSWTLKSKHLVGKAIDVVPYPVDWNDLNKFAAINEAFKKASAQTGIAYRWGGDWNNSDDYRDEIKRGTYDGGHFELV